MVSKRILSELEQVLNGEPWHGSSVNNIIAHVDQKKVHDKGRGPHNIADVLLHMIAWTEETTERLKGKFASDPARGDWPDPSSYPWTQLVDMFNEANEHLNNCIVSMNDDLLVRMVNDDRYPELAENITYEQLIKRIIQHHIYHSAQIAILNK